ncbi:uncharacterized protein LOC124957210 [Vespa velutina]|uniref:uncharacterized protein LOC124957210 n=1 Tax=Vespa velutina TaxID=202808 RepID=UPI001FB24A67|nr:uncharacterized protein LOC124957210 [Vespa velutina]
MKNQMYYYFILIIEYVIIIIVCMVGIANYSMFIAIIQHACALFDIVEWRVNERFKKKSHNFYYAISNNELNEENEWIIGIIEFYKNAIKFVDLLKSFYETIHLFEELLIFVFSFTLNKTEGLTKLFYVIGSFFVIYVYFYLAQKLIDHNTNVFLIFCEIPFYSLSLKTQKLLPLLIMKSMRQCSLSLTSAIVVSHDLLATSIKKSFSFAAVLFNLR